MTHADVVLLTLYRLSENGCDPDLVYAGVPINRLIVEAWKLDESLGLAGFDHPDARKVHNAMYGRVGLMSQGFAERVGRWRSDNRVRLTASGIERAARLASSMATITKGESVGPRK